MNTRISVLMTTFRFGGMDIFLSSLAKQTFEEPWEIVLVDELYEERKEAVSTYARSLDLEEKLKHLPAPDAREGTVSNYSRSLNEGLVHCDGECILFEMDFTMLETTLLERLWNLHKAFPASVISGLAHPITTHPDIVDPEGPITLFDVPFTELDLEKWTVVRDDRFRQGLGIVQMMMLALLDDQGLYEYGYTVSPNYLVSTDALLDINGWDEAFDEGGHGFDDMDLMTRLKHSADALFLIDTHQGSNAYCMEHPWSKMPEENPNPNRERHIRRAAAIAARDEVPWTENDRNLREARIRRFIDEIPARQPNRGLLTSSLKFPLGKDVILKERNPTQLVRLGWVFQMAGGKVLEVGAREGQYPENDGWVRFDLERYSGTHVRGTGEVLPFKDNTFDTVLLAEIIEHVEDPYSLLTESLRVTREKVVLTTPNEWAWHVSFDPFAEAFKQHRRYYTFQSLLQEIHTVSGSFHIFPLDYRGFSFFLVELFKEQGPNS